ncbi:MAG: hypothetical protein WCK57_06300 [Verrucomicrobiae bacterium]
MNGVIAEPVVTNRCKIDEVFASPFIELIGLAPRNPVVRGLILSQTGRLPEPERVTFEQIKEWVETTCIKRIRPPDAPRTHAGDGFAVKVEFSETEYGRARYSVGRSGSDEFALDADELLPLIHAAIDDETGVEAVVDKIAELIDTEAWERCEPNLDDYGEYDYDEHDSNDAGNGAVEFSRTQVRDRLLGFLRERHPGLLEELT